MCGIAFPEMETKKYMGYSRCYNLSDVYWPDKEIVKICNYSFIINDLNIHKKNENLEVLTSKINDIKF